MTTTTPQLVENAPEMCARSVPDHPVPLCRNFTPKSEPAEFWCANCGWNEPLHDSEAVRSAIAAELGRLGGAR